MSCTGCIHKEEDRSMESAERSQCEETLHESEEGRPQREKAASRFISKDLSIFCQQQPCKNYTLLIFKPLRISDTGTDWLYGIKRFQN